jgi:hypothetical protein
MAMAAPRNRLQADGFWVVCVQIDEGEVDIPEE